MCEIIHQYLCKLYMLFLSEDEWCIASKIYVGDGKVMLLKKLMVSFYNKQVWVASNRLEVDHGTDLLHIWKLGQAIKWIRSSGKPDIRAALAEILH